MRVRRCHSLLALAVSLFTLCISTDVHAQAWLSDRKRAEGSGIRVGDLELHPGIGVEGGYLNNVFNADKNEQDTFALRVAPHLLLSTLGEERGGTNSPRWVDFRGGLSASLLQFFTPSQTTIGTNADLELTIAPRRPVAFVLTESFNRTARPFTEPGFAGTGSTKKPPSYARDQENIGGKFVFSTRSGLLKSGVGYRFGYDWFEANEFKANNNTTHNVLLDANWEFLPKTALFYDGTYTRQDYPNKASMPQVVLTSSDQISSRMGLNGAITKYIAATLAAGYTAGFTANNNDYEGMNANAELRYQPVKDIEFALGYDRALSTAYQGGHQRLDRVAARTRMLFGGAAMVGAKIGVEFIKFGVDPIQGPRSDRRYFADLTGEYRFVDWLAVTGQAGLVVDDTDFKFRSTTTPVAFDPAKYTAFEAWLGLRAFY